MSVELDVEGHAVTVLKTKPVDQAGLMGIINSAYVMRLPLVSVACLSLEK